MIRLSATKAELTITETETITSGAQRVFECAFTVNSDWDGLNRTAVFRAGTKAVSVLLGDDNTAEIPWEVLQTAGITLRIGLYGTNSAGDVLPTVWADAGMICTGAYLGDDAYPPTPGAYEQLVEIAENAEKIAQSVRDDADAGKFDGAQGPQGEQGPVGQQGPVGETGPQGPQGIPGEAATIAVGTVTTGTPETPADVTNTGTENAAVFDFVIPQGPPGKDGVQINDNAINTTDAWSSLKIVDTLCPAFTVTGNPVTCTPVEDYPLSVSVEIVPHQDGTGDPSPDNVRPIIGYDKVSLWAGGVNLLSDANFKNSENNGIIYTKIDNGVIHVEGTATGSSQSNTIDVLQLPPGTYHGIVTEDDVQQYLVVKKATGSVNYYNISKQSVTIGAGDTILYYYIAVAPGKTVSNNAYVFLATEQTEFVPYNPASKTITVPLGQTVYGGTLNATSGDLSIDWVGYTANGTENVSLGQQGTITNRWYFQPTIPTLGNNGRTLICCDKFKTLINASQDAVGCFCTGDNLISIRIPNTDYPTAESVKEWLRSNTPKFVYKTSDIVRKKIESTEIIALSGVNTIYADSGDVTVSGRSDPKAYIQQQISDAITSAVAITGGT